MRVCFHAPGPPLGVFVHDFWLYEGYSSPLLREKILPTGTFELVFNLLEDELRIYGPGGACRRFSGALISGPYSGYFESDSLEEASVLGVHFRPGGAFPFFGGSVGEMSDTHMDLDAAWGPAAAELRERLACAPSTQERFALVEQALRDRLAATLEGHPAVPFALRALSGSTRVHEIAHHLDLSGRRLIEVFRSEVGLTPKTFSRVLRFQRVISRIGPGGEPDWALLSLECGFFDQAHLINDFRDFTGMTPGGYQRHLNELRRRGLRRKRNHVPVGPGDRPSLFSNTRRPAWDDCCSRRCV